MATVPVLISLQEYLDTDYEPDVHYVHGELEERSVGKFEHGKIQGWLFQIFNLKNNRGARPSQLSNACRSIQAKYALLMSQS